MGSHVGEGVATVSEQHERLGAAVEEAQDFHLSLILAHLSLRLGRVSKPWGFN